MINHTFIAYIFPEESSLTFMTTPNVPAPRISHFSYTSAKYVVPIKSNGSSFKDTPSRIARSFCSNIFEEDVGERIDSRICNS